MRREAVGVFAGAACSYWLMGVLDRPWARQYLHLSLWTPCALCGFSLYRLAGGRREMVWPVEPPRLILDLLKIYALSKVIRWAANVRRVTFSDLKRWATQAATENVALLAPARVRAEFEKVEKDLKKSLRKKSDRKYLVSLPEEPLASREKLMEGMRSSSEREDEKWRAGFVSGAVYHGEPEHLKLLNAASEAYCVSNPLHSDIWPTLNLMESEIVSMTARLLDGGDRGVCGALTSGGTESIVMAIKAHRDMFAKERGVSRGEVVACVTAHAAVDKACELLGLKLFKIPADPITFRMNLGRAKRGLTSDTILIYASAPCFPQGVVDDVEAISRLARRAGVGCHVDCCLGGFILPFLDDTDSFDFGLPGVTSMSVDTHKYGYSVKGSSVVLYRSPEVRRYMYFCFPDWTGGLYATPSIPGSRSGSIIAATWVSLVSIGRKGFRERALRIVRAANRISTQLRANFPQLKLLGADPAEGRVPAMIVCFASSSDASGRDLVNIYDVNDAMVERGWSLNALQNPPCLHICCTLRTIGHEDRFLHDLKESVDQALAKRTTNASSSTSSSSSSSSAAIYGMASSMPAGPVSQVMRIYTDIQLSVPEEQ